MNNNNDYYNMQKSQRISSIKAKWGSKAQFLRSFLFENLAPYTEDVKRCIIGNAPTFIEINEAYGPGTSQAWLTSAWTSLNEYAGNSGKMTKKQIKELAVATVSAVGYIKISEFMLFARYFKEGAYNHIWGRNVDPLQLMTALGRFIQDRNQLIAQYENEQREEERRKQDEQKPPMTWEEYCAKNHLPKDYNPLHNLNFRA